VENVAASRFSRVFEQYERNVSTNRNRKTALSCLQTRVAHLKGLGVHQLRTYYFNIIIKGEFKNIE
jgi:FAD synthase